MGPLVRARGSRVEDTWGSTEGAWGLAGSGGCAAEGAASAAGGADPWNSPLICDAASQSGMPSRQTRSAAATCPRSASRLSSTVETGPNR